MFSLYRFKQAKYIYTAIFASLIYIIYPAIVETSFAESFLQTKIEKVSGPQVSGADRIKQVLRNLDLPKEIGIIKEVHVPKNPNSQFVINIQDLHCNYEAQQNIARIIDYLTHTYQIKVISVEGGSGKIDTTFYRNLPDDKVKEQVADYFLREARINGTEYFAITTKKDIALYGAEDQKYYDKNLDAFLKALPNRERILEDIALLENDLNILKNRIYNKRLTEFDNHIVAYDNGALGFEDYCMYLRQHYPDDKFKREFTNLSQLAESIELKNKLNLEKAEKERTELIDLLSKSLARQELEEFLKVTMEFKAKTIEAVAYHNTLKKLYDRLEAKTKTLSGAYAQLAQYIDYLNKHETLDKFELFNELDTLVERIKELLYTSYTQKTLDRYLKTIRWARNLYSTKLLTRDIPYIRRYKSDFNAERMKKFIKDEAKRLKIDLPMPGDLREMEKTLPMLEDFYFYAQERNNIMASNTLKAMTDEKEPIGILVTGGFHTDGMSEYFKDKRVNYAVIVPKVEKLDEDDTRYIEALKGRKTPFEEMVERGEMPRKEYFKSK